MYKVIGADGKQYGPISVEVLRQWIAEGRVNSQTLAQSEGGTDWKPLGSFAEFGTIFSSATPPPVANFAIPQPVPTAPKNCGMAIAGLVMGILALIQCCSLLFGILGIIFSSIAISQINQRPTELTGKGMAQAGLAMSIAGIVINIVIMVIYWATIAPIILRHCGRCF